MLTVIGLWILKGIVILIGLCAAVGFLGWLSHAVPTTIRGLINAIRWIIVAILCVFGIPFDPFINGLKAFPKSRSRSAGLFFLSLLVSVLLIVLIAGVIWLLGKIGIHTGTNEHGWSAFNVPLAVFGVMTISLTVVELIWLLIHRRKSLRKKTHQYFWRQLARVIGVEREFYFD